MDDRTLERDIEALLAVDPTPAYRARLQQRIAAEIPLGSTPMPWRLVLATAAVVLAGTVAGIRWLAVDHTVPADLLTPRRIEAMGHVAPARLKPGAVRGSISGRSNAAAMAQRSEPSSPVILDPLEVRAWRRLLSGADMVLMELPLAAAATQASDGAGSDDVLLPPITIEPLVVESHEGVQP